MVETVESDDDSARSATCADNEEESAEPFELLLSCDNCHRCRDEPAIEMELHHPVYRVLVTNVHLESGAEVSSILIHLYSYFDFVDNSHAGASETVPCFWQAMKATAFF